MYIFSETIASECSISHMAPHICRFLCTCETPMKPSRCIFSVTIAGFPAIDSAIAIRFWKLLWPFAKLYITHMTKFCMPTFGNCRNSSKTACTCLYFVRLPTLGNPASLTWALFLAHWIYTSNTTGFRLVEKLSIPSWSGEIYLRLNLFSC